MCRPPTFSTTSSKHQFLTLPTFHSKLHTRAIPLLLLRFHRVREVPWKITIDQRFIYITSALGLRVVRVLWGQESLLQGDWLPFFVLKSR